MRFERSRASGASRLNFRKQPAVDRLKRKVSFMNTTGIAPELAVEFQEVLDDLAKGIRRPEKMQAACERMDRLREENRQLFGEQNLAVELVRQARNEA